MPSAPWQRLFLMTALTMVTATPVLARPAPLRWEKIHVLHALPSVVFARLGLTHSTRNGLTRDGKQGVPDPTFPPGLTDVVPYDTDRLLLVRGTVGGLELFRSRIADADVTIPALHLKAELTRIADTDQTPLATQEMDSVQDGVPVQVSLGEGDAARVYQLKTHANADGSLWVGCRVSLPLPPAPTESATPSAVFVPDRVWTDQNSRKVRLGETVIFEDRATIRQASSRRLGVTGTDTDEDYTLRVTLMPIPAARP